jgi:hypothetical protein
MPRSVTADDLQMMRAEICKNRINNFRFLANWLLQVRRRTHTAHTPHTRRTPPHINRTSTAHHRGA